MNAASGLANARRASAQNSARRPLSRARLSTLDLVHFTQQLGVLLDAGVPLVDGLRAIAEQETRPALRQLFEEVTANIAAGNAISDSLARYRASFGSVYVDTIAAAEQSGTLGPVLESLGDMLERDHELRKTVRGAFLYPACVSGVLVIAVGFLTMFVLPRFASMFASRGMDLPLVTRVMIDASAFVRSNWIMLVVTAVGGGFAFRSAWGNPGLREKLDAWTARVPIVGAILRDMAIARFACVLAIGIRSGVSLITAIESSSRASGRPLLRRDADQVQKAVHRGGRLADGMKACRYLTPFARRLISIGEEAGELPRMLDVIARHYEREVRRRTKLLATTLEPLLVLVITCVVLAVALAIFLPMWSMADLMGG